jgi:hypothetical protein
MRPSTTQQNVEDSAMGQSVGRKTAAAISAENEPSRPEPDAVELALAAAIERTNDPAALVALTTELKARRESRARIVSLFEERMRRRKP